jgi:hypothetical protein
LRSEKDAAIKARMVRASQSEATQYRGCEARKSLVFGGTDKKLWWLIPNE